MYSRLTHGTFMFFYQLNRVDKDCMYKYYVSGAALGASASGATCEEWKVASE